jgi:hypothetical protein
MMWMTDASGGVVFFNQRWYEFTRPGARAGARPRMAGRPAPRRSGRGGCRRAGPVWESRAVRDRLPGPHRRRVAPAGPLTSACRATTLTTTSARGTRGSCASRSSRSTRSRSIADSCRASAPICSTTRSWPPSSNWRSGSSCRPSLSVSRRPTRPDGCRPRAAPMGRDTGSPRRCRTARRGLGQPPGRRPRRDQLAPIEARRSLDCGEPHRGTFRTFGAARACCGLENGHGYP